jgi:hypothetical protein
MQIQEKIRSVTSLDFCDIEDKQLLNILDHVVSFKNIPDFLSEDEKSVLLGTLIEHFGGNASLTELGRIFLGELVFRSCKNYRGDE